MSGKVWIAVGLVVLTLVAFAPVVNCGFVDLDDSDYVFDNPKVYGGVTAENFAWGWETSHSFNWHPLTWWSLQLDATLWGGLNPLGYHITNVLLHAASVVVLFLFLASATGAAWRSALVAAIFAVHPLRAESVAWITERKDVLSGLFWMLTLAAYLLYARRPGILRYLLVLVVFAVGLLAKPMLVTLPCVLLLLDFWPLRRWQQMPSGDEPACAKVPLRWLVWEKVPLLMLSATASLITHAVQLPAESYPLAVRLTNAVTTYGKYLADLFYPVGLMVMVRHPERTLYAPFVLGLVVVLALTALAVWHARSRPYLLVGWLWYLGTLVPVIGLIQVGGQPSADRYTYIPMIGFTIALVWGLADLVTWLRVPKAVLAGATTVLLGLCVIGTRQMIGTWRNSETLWTQVTQCDPMNGYAQYRLANAYLATNRPEEAEAMFRHTLELQPDFLKVRAALIALLVQQGRRKEAALEMETMAKQVHDNPDAAP